MRWGTFTTLCFYLRSPSSSSRPTLLFTWVKTTNYPFSLSRSFPSRLFSWPSWWTFWLTSILPQCKLLTCHYHWCLLNRSRNWTHYPISKCNFWKSYTSVCANGVSAHPNDIWFLPLLFVVLAITVHVVPEHIAGDARSRRLTSLRYYWSCKSMFQMTSSPLLICDNDLESTTIHAYCCNHTTRLSRYGPNVTPG